jgi:predicted ATP-grasp superfamily ATP-dependent carboligase
MEIMSNLNGKSATVLVTDAGRGSAIAVIRSLGRKGYRVIAADSDPRSIGFRSRYAHEQLVYPVPEAQPQEFCARLLDTVKARGVDLIIPVTDLTGQPLARSREAFGRITRLALPGDEMLQVVTDKDKTWQLAKKLGVPVPETYVVATTKEALAMSERLGWPLVLKPQSSRKLREGNRIDSFKVTYAGDAEDLKRRMHDLEGKSSVLLQRYCPGVGHGVELLMSEGTPLAAFQHKRLREIPITGGPSAYRESVELDPVLYDYALRLLKEVRWTGLAMVEFKVGQRGPTLMEINGRIWGSIPLAVASGMDFPVLLAELFLHGAAAIKPQLQSNYRIGVRCRDLQRDLMWITNVLRQRRRYQFLDMPSRKSAVLALLELFDPRRKFDLLTLNDPMPGLAELPRILKKFRSKMQEGE